MNAKSAVFAVLSIRPHKIKELIDKLPYSRHTVYKTLKFLAEEGLIEKKKEKGEVVVDISKDYTSQKLREIYIKALSFGIDPEMLTRDSTLSIWKLLAVPRTLKELQKRSGFSYLWVRNIVKFLKDSNLAVYKKRKPITAVHNEVHELNTLLKQFAEKKKEPERIYYEGIIPFERLIKSPAEIEEVLYQKIDSSLTIKDTGFIVRGEDKLTVLESVEEGLSLEELFFREINIPEGVEDFCIRLIANKKLDYKRLLALAKEKNMVNIVGCYLDILNDIKRLLDPKVIREFHKNVTKQKVIFLKGEKRYGKSGWEHEYEKKWNVDIYLDIGTIRHGLRSI